MSTKNELVPVDVRQKMGIYGENRPVIVHEAKRNSPVIEANFEMGSSGFKLGTKLGWETETYTRYEFLKE